MLYFYVFYGLYTILLFTSVLLSPVSIYHRLIQGLHITRDPSDGVCYLIAVGATNMSEIHDFERMIHDSNGKEVTAHDTNRDGEKEWFKILPGEIEDVSFIPPRARKECVNGYKWLSVVSESKGWFQDDLKCSLRLFFHSYSHCRMQMRAQASDKTL